MQKGNYFTMSAIRGTIFTKYTEDAALSYRQFEKYHFEEIQNRKKRK